MKKINSVISALLAAILLGLSFVSCERHDTSVPTEEPTAVCIVLSKHANAPTISTTHFYDLVYTAAYNYGSVSAVSIEGEPKVLCDYEINPPDKWVDNTKRRQIAADNAQVILSQIASAEASTPETDTLTALSMGSDILQSKTESVKLLCIDDSFLSTTGLLNFAASNLMEQDPDIIVEQLEERFAIPDLSGVDVMVMGMAQTCGKQTSLGSAYEHKLESIWTAIFEASNCASLNIDRTPLGKNEPQTSLAVSTVTIISDVLTFNIPQKTETENDIVEETTPALVPSFPEPAPIETEKVEPEQLLPDVVMFDETTVKFVGNSDMFVNPELAAKTLEPVAKLLQDYSNLNVILAGMTASVGGDGTELSLKRAEAVKSILIAAGVDETQIRCVGLGRTDNFLRVDDTDSNGNLIESMAMLNRSVFLFAEDSDTADKLNIH